MSEFDWQAMHAADQSACDLVFGAFIGALLGLTVSTHGIVNNNYVALAATLFWLSSFVYFNNSMRAYVLRNQWGALIMNLAGAVLSLFVTLYFVSQLGVPRTLIAVALATWLFVTMLDSMGRALSRRRLKD